MGVRRETRILRHANTSLKCLWHQLIKLDQSDLFLHADCQAANQSTVLTALQMAQKNNQAFYHGHKTNKHTSLLFYNWTTYPPIQVTALWYLSEAIYHE